MSGKEEYEKQGGTKRYVVPPCFKFGTFLQQCIDFCLDGIFRSCPYEFVVHLAAGLDEYDERDISYREFHGEVVVLVDIAFADDYLAFVLFGELFDDGGQRAARTAPFSQASITIMSRSSSSARPPWRF